MPAELVKQAATLATFSRKPRNLGNARYLRDTCLISLSLSLLSSFLAGGMGWALFTNGVTKRMKADRVRARVQA